MNRILYLGNNSSATGNRGSFPGINDLIILIFITCRAFCEKCSAVFFHSSYTRERTERFFPFFVKKRLKWYINFL
nr:MAG TPA: hypothetical protein [Caudoviricetes sp.]